MWIYLVQDISPQIQDGTGPNIAVTPSQILDSLDPL